MDKIRQALKTTYNYSDYELELVKYTLLSIASEFSKILLLYIFYIIIGKVLSFTVFILLLSLIRFNSGGFHCKHYTTCLLLTFVISYLAVVILPQLITPDILFIQFFTIVCILINYYIGPIVSPLRPSPNSVLLKHCQNNSCLIIFAFFIIVSIFNSHSIIYQYLIIGFWTIILHTCQMMFAKILMFKGGRKNVS